MKTIGESRVRTSFNPGNNDKVQNIKERFAHLINDLENERDDEPRSEKNRCISLAQTELETACMYAVKAVTG